MHQIAICGECLRDKNPVPGHGPLPSDILFIGEAPGQNEDITGVPFCGMTGYELDNTYLRLAGIKRQSVRVTNTVRCRPENNRKPGAKLVTSCSECNLRSEIAMCKPKLIVLMGATACSLDPSIDTNLEHGFPRTSTFLGWTGTVVPMIHPASGLHDGNQMTPLLEDFTRLRPIVAGRYTPPVNPHPVVDYSYCDSVRHLRSYIQGYGNELSYNAIDTEGHGRRKFSIQLSREPGTGIMIMCDEKKVVAALRDEFLKLGPLVMQFAEHDLDFLQELDFDTRNPNLVVWDDMRDSYNMGNLPQGLKQMTFRTQHVRMRTWEDVVLPHSKAKLMEWLPRALEYAAANFGEQKEIKTYHKSKLEQALNRITKSFVKDLAKTQRAVDKLPAVDGYHGLLSKCWRPPAVTATRFPVWLESAVSYAKEKLTIEKVKYEPRRGDLEKIIARILQHAPKPTYKPWDKLREALSDMPDSFQFDYVEKALGEMPLLGIGNVPEDEALMYAVGDSDMTLRVALWMEKQRAELQQDWSIADGDEDH